MEDRKEVHLKNNVQSGKYGLKVETKTSYFNGDGMKDEDMPGWFMEQDVYLTKASRAEEKLIRQMGKKLPMLLVEIPLYGEREITSEPRGYELLKHKDLVGQVKQNVRGYINKERLVELLKES